MVAKSKKGLDWEKFENHWTSPTKSQLWVLQVHSISGIVEVAFLWATAVVLVNDTCISVQRTKNFMAPKGKGELRIPWHPRARGN